MNFDFASHAQTGIALDDFLSEIERAALIRRLAEQEAAYSFRHVLVQETAQSTLLKNERKNLHRRVAESLALVFPDDLDGLAATLAEHYAESETWDRVVEYSVRAGNGALRVYAQREALVHFERALAALEHVSSRSALQEYDALMGWAEAASKLRPYSEQLEKLGRAEGIARALNDKPRLARALYRTGRVLVAQGYAFHSLVPLSEVFTLADELGDERFTVIPTFSMGLASLNSDPRAALGLLNRAIELAARYGDRDTEVTAWSVKGMVHAELGEFAAAREALERAEKELCEIKSPLTISDVNLFEGWAWLDMGDAEKGLGYARRSVQVAAASGNKDCECSALDCVGYCELTAQQVPQAASTFREAIHHSQFSGAAIFENMGRAGLALAEFSGGRADAVNDLERAYARTFELDDQYGGAVIARGLGGIYAELGDTTRAEGFLRKAVEYFRSHELVPQLLRSFESIEQVLRTQERTAEADETRAESQRLQQRLADKNKERTSATG